MRRERNASGLVGAPTHPPPLASTRNATVALPSTPMITCAPHPLVPSAPRGVPVLPQSSSAPCPSPLAHSALRLRPVTTSALPARPGLPRPFARRTERPPVATAAMRNLLLAGNRSHHPALSAGSRGGGWSGEPSGQRTSPEGNSSPVGALPSSGTLAATARRLRTTTAARNLACSTTAARGSVEGDHEWACVRRGVCVALAADG
jgi:hypothetical protein